MSREKVRGDVPVVFQHWGLHLGTTTDVLLFVTHPAPVAGVGHGAEPAVVSVCSSRSLKAPVMIS